MLQRGDPCELDLVFGASSSVSREVCAIACLKLALPVNVGDLDKDEAFANYDEMRHHVIKFTSVLAGLEVP